MVLAQQSSKPVVMQQSPLVLTPPPPPAPSIFLTCGHVWDGKSEKLLGKSYISVAWGKDQGDLSRIQGGVPGVLPGTILINLESHTCLPGLIDTHTHILLQGDITAADYDEQLLKQSPEYRTILATVNARRALEYGFTSIRDLETEGAGYADADVKKAINGGVIPGPRMQVATRALDVTGAYPLQGYAPGVMVPHGVQLVDGADNARAAVREQISHGADWIKVYSDRSYRVREDGVLDDIPTFTRKNCARSWMRRTGSGTKWRRMRWRCMECTIPSRRAWIRSSMGTTLRTRI